MPIMIMQDIRLGPQEVQEGPVIASGLTCKSFSQSSLMTTSMALLLLVPKLYLSKLPSCNKLCWTLSQQPVTILSLEALEQMPHTLTLLLIMLFSSPLVSSHLSWNSGSQFSLPSLLEALRITLPTTSTLSSSFSRNQL